MTLDIEKMKAAAMAATQGEWSSYNTIVYLPNVYGGFDLHDSPNPINNATFIATATPSIILEPITRLEAAESELNVCSIEYGDVRDSYLHYKEKYEAAEKDAARWSKHVELYSNKLCVPEEDVIREIDAAMKESEK